MRRTDWVLWLAIAVLPLSLRAQQASSSQQPDPLPGDPIKTGEEAVTRLLPDEPILLPEEAPLRPVEEAPAPVLPRQRLQLALDAMEPVLPPFDLAPADHLLAGAVRVFVKKFEFDGNTVFSDRQLGKVVADFAGREITSEELEEARVALTKHYIESGYITSGAVLEDQDVASGVIRFHIVEGRLTTIHLEENFWFRSWWLRHQLRRAAGEPVNFNHLKAGLQLLRQNASISRINAELKPDVKPGESILEVRVKDEQPFRFSFEISNRRPPSVGEGIGEIALADLNLTGHNDPLEMRWGIVRWTKDGSVEYADFDNIGGSYEFSITPWDTTLKVRAGRSDSSIIDETFAALGITSRSTEFGVAIQQSLYRTLNDSVSLSFGADRKHSETFLLGRPFSLSSGAIDGESDVFALRFTQEWVNRSQVHVLALRSVFSFGLYAFGSARAGAADVGPAGFDPEAPDSKFFAWLGQAQYVRRIFDFPSLKTKPESWAWNALRETLLVLRANGQISDEPLLSLEQFSIGGMQSVRGYRENQLLRDNGVFASAELRAPVWLSKDKTPVVSIASFFDFGEGWNANDLDGNYQSIYSAGVGLIVNATRHAQVTIYWGHAFTDFHEKKESLQDSGIHFAVSINAF